MSNHLYNLIQQELQRRAAEVDAAVWHQFLHGDTQPAAVDKTLAAVDAAVEGRCAGPGCDVGLTAASPSAWYCSGECQEAYLRQGATRPHEVRGSQGVAPDQMRWRPDLVAAFDESELTLEEELTDCGLLEQITGRAFTRRCYRHRDGRRFLRLDDGHRWVGAFCADETEEDGRDLWRRLERELTDPRRLADQPSGGSGDSYEEPCGNCVGRCNPDCGCPCWYGGEPLPRFDPASSLPAGENWSPSGGRVTWGTLEQIRVDLAADVGQAEDFGRASEAIRQLGESLAGFGPAAVSAFRQWLTRAGDAELERQSLRSVCRDEAMVERALAAADERGLSVPEMYEAVAVGRYAEDGWADPQPTGAVFWMPQLADPEAPTAAELEGAVPIGTAVDDRVQVHWSTPGSSEPDVTELVVSDVRPDGTLVTEPEPSDG